jgi:hypothetical protein
LKLNSYCVFCKTGSELSVAEKINIIDKSVNAIAPTRVIQEKRGGIWVKKHKILLPGYVFLFSNEDLETGLIRNLTDLYKVLSYDRGIRTLIGKDRDYAMWIWKYEKATYTGGLSLAVPNTEPIWLEATVLRPDLVDRYLDVQMNRALKNIPVLAAVGSKFVFGGGDCAGNRGLLYSPAVFKNQIVPRLRRISDKCKEYGIFHSFGSDGYFWDVADSLYIDSGIDAHYEADCICGMDIRSIRSKYPNITVLGGISSATLETGTEDEVRAQTMEAINAAKELGGAIVGCSNLITPATPMKNFTLMMDLLHRYK